MDVKNLYDALEPIKVSVNALKASNCNVLTADIILESLLNKLESNTGSTGQKLYVAVKERINERRLKPLASIARYLHDPHEYANAQTSAVLNYCTKREIIKSSFELISRLMPEEVDNEESGDLNDNSVTIDLNESNENSDTSLQSSTNHGYEKELFEAIKSVSNAKNKSTAQVQVDRKALERDFKLLEATGEKTKTVTLLNNIVLSVPPSSTEPERAFSLAGGFVTKIRNNLSDAAIDALLFLKYYFKGSE